MANLPEKNITTVDKVTSIPSNANLYINANGEFRQATVDDVLKASPVIADSIANQYKNASGSPILLTDSAKGVAIDFEVKGRSIQDGEPTPDNPITPKSVGDMGYFDGELLQGAYAGSTGAWGSTNNYVCSRNMIPCKAGDKIKLEYAEKISQLMILFYDSNKNFISYSSLLSVSELEVNAVENACYFNININNADGITPQTAKHICVTINDKYALIVDSKGKNLLDISKFGKIGGSEKVTVKDNTITIASGNYVYGVKFSNEDVGLEVGKTYTFSSKDIAGTTVGYRIGYADGTFGDASYVRPQTITITKEVSTILYYVGMPYTGTTDVVIGDMQIELGDTATTYEPYIHSRKYIPISAPLRGIGEVTDVASLSECKVNRKFTKAVFDGSDDEGWAVSGGFAIITVSDAISTNSTYGELICSHFRYVGQSADVGICFNYNQRFHFAITQSTLDEWKTWLQANPITVIYELAEPTTESIEPIDVDTFEGVTQISVSDNAEMEVEYPTSKVAGIASIGWSKGRRAEYDLEQLKAQMLALQTTIVSSI